MMKSATRLEDIRNMAVEDANACYDESGCTKTPIDGWDSWLINGVGFTEVCRLFGEPELENDGEWSESMQNKMQAYCDQMEQTMWELSLLEGVSDHGNETDF